MADSGRKIDVDRDFVHLASFFADGEDDNATALALRTLRRIARQRPDLADQARSLSRRLSAGDLTRQSRAHPLPIDADSRLELLRREDEPTIGIDPVWAQSVIIELDATIHELSREDALNELGLKPTRSLLFVGPPGVGKTLAARWLSRRLHRPLLTLDLAAVMSSFLGRTGNNIRSVLDYARGTRSVLLLDEFDAIAKRRDDVAEIGELKRLVTVLLQQVDDWPSGQLLIAATNHPELLDTAVWRRFDRIVDFPNPNRDEVLQVMHRLLASDPAGLGACEELLPVLAALFEGHSFSDIEREVNTARRHALVSGTPLVEVLASRGQHASHQLPVGTRVAFGMRLEDMGFSQRRAAEAAGVARDTLRKRRKRAMKKKGSGDSNGA